MSKIEDQIKKVFQEWGEESALDLKDEAEAALKRAGRKNPNTISLEFDETVKTSGGDVILEIRAVRLNQPAKYWRAIEEGRGAGKKAPPSDVFGKKWQNEQGIDPRVVLMQIQSRKGLKTRVRKLTRPKKKMDYNKATKTLAFLIARSIGKKGIVPKPFVGKVLTDERIADLRQRLTPLLGEKYKLIIKGLE